MIDGVKLTPRQRHADDRGYVTEIFRSDEEHFEKFGQTHRTFTTSSYVTGSGPSGAAASPPRNSI